MIQFNLTKIIGQLLQDNESRYDTPYQRDSPV